MTLTALANATASAAALPIQSPAASDVPITTAMPSDAPANAAQLDAGTRSRKTSQESIATMIGDVDCSSSALAIVVVVMATTCSTKVVARQSEESQAIDLASRNAAQARGPTRK